MADRYVLDTGFFVAARYYYRKVFPSFWSSLDKAAGSEKISSVNVVYEELKRYGGEQQDLLDWLKNNKNIFSDPTKKEQSEINNIFKYPEYQKIVNEKQRLKGDDIADPYVIAKAKCYKDTVVTGEVPIKGSASTKSIQSIKIPDICTSLEIGCISREEFMVQLGWKF